MDFGSTHIISVSRFVMSIVYDVRFFITEGAIEMANLSYILPANAELLTAIQVGVAFITPSYHVTNILPHPK